MTATLLRAITIGSAIALSACASQQGGDTRVTRFHLGQPIAPAQIAVEPLDPRAKGSLEFDTYANAVSGQLTRLGFTMAPGLATSELVAVVDIQRGTQEQVARRGSGLSVGIGGGGGSFGGGVGGGVGVSFPIGKARDASLTITELAVQLKRRSEGTVVWEGRAQTAAPSASIAADPAAAASKLADALFRDFPGESGRTISVR